MTALPHVDVRVPSAIYRALYPHAKARGCEVGDLLVELAVGTLQRRTALDASAHAASERDTASEIGTLPSVAATGARPRRMSPDRLEKLRELAALGYSSGQIAGVIGVSRSSVQVYVKRIREGRL